MSTTGEILQEANQPFQPGFGSGQSHAQKQATLTPPAENEEQPLDDPLLQQAAKIEEKRRDEAYQKYLRVVARYVDGDATADDIHQACEAAGKSLSHFRDDAALFRERCELQQLVATEQAERKTLAELQSEAEQARKIVRDRTIAVATAQAELRAAQAEADETDRAAFSQRQRLADVASASRRLGESKFSQFSSSDELALRQRIDELEADREQVERELSELQQREDDLQNRLTSQRQQLSHLQSRQPNTGSNASAIQGDEMLQRQAQWTRDVSQLETAIADLERQLGRHRQTSPAEIEAKDKRRDKITAEIETARKELHQLLSTQ